MEPQDQTIFCVEFMPGSARCVKVPGARCGDQPCAIMGDRAGAYYEEDQEGY